MAGFVFLTALLGVVSCDKKKTEDPSVDPKGHKSDVADAECSCSGADGCYASGYEQLYGDGASDNSAAAAAPCFRKSCDMGNADACRGLAGMFDFGQGIEPNRARATQFWAKAVKLHETGCEGGGLRDCFELGILMYRGQGISEDRAEATRLYRQACDGGNANGCVELKMVCGGVSYPACFQ
jgi:hypothetical protein